MRHTIGTISNYCGGLKVQELEGRYFWWLEDWDGTEDMEEIPKYLYDALIKLEKESKVTKGE